MSPTRTRWLLRNLVLPWALLGCIPAQAGDTPEAVNLLVDIPRAFLDAAVEDPIERTDPLHKAERGYEINAVIRSRAVNHIELFPSEHYAVLDVVGDGTQEVTTAARVGPLCLDFGDLVQFQVRKHLFLDCRGFTEGTGLASASDDNVLHNIATNHHGLIDTSLKRLTCRVYKKNKTRLEEFVARGASEALLKELDKQIEPTVRTTNQSYMEGLRDLQKQGLVFRRLDYQSTTERIILRAVAETPDQPPPVAPPPAMAAVPYLGMRVHEAVLNHLFQKTFEGKTYTGEEIAKQTTNLLQLAPGKEPQRDERPWSITLAKQKPLTVNFADHGFVLTLRSSGFTVGDTTHPGMHVVARYKFAKEPNEVVALRQGDVDVFPLDFVPGSGKKMSGLQQTRAALLEARFEKVFKERIKFEDIPLTGASQKLGPLVATHADGEKGWLLLTWRRGQAKKGQ